MNVRFLQNSMYVGLAILVLCFVIFVIGSSFFDDNHYYTKNIHGPLFALGFTSFYLSLIPKLISNLKRKLIPVGTFIWVGLALLISWGAVIWKLLCV